MPPEPRLLSAAAIRALEASLRKRVTGEVDFSTGSRALYATDASNYRQTPIGVVAPRITDDVVETVRTCREYGAAILPHGAGTSLAGQCCNVAVVIDMSRHLRTVLNVDRAAKTARVQPGLVLDDLQEVVKPLGLMYGPDPATHAWCTLGGMIGNNSCGVHSVAAGLTADVVEELDVLTADGVRLTVGGRKSPAEVDALVREPGRRGENVWVLTCAIFAACWGTMAIAARCTATSAKAVSTRVRTSTSKRLTASHGSARSLAKRRISWCRTAARCRVSMVMDRPAPSSCRRCLARRSWAHSASSNASGIPTA